MSRRFRVTCVHLLISSCVAVICALLIFWLWYPPPYDVLARGFGLFGILVGVDIVLGPALTALIANPIKRQAELLRDIACIGILQLIAFGYGLNTIASARPVYLAFEVDRFRVVTASDIDAAMLEKAPPSLRSLPWTGPRLIATSPPVDNDGLFSSLRRSMNGTDLAMQPDHWIEYSSARDAVARAARPVALVLQHYPDAADSVRELASKEGVAVGALKFLPLMSRKESWIALLDGQESRIVGYLPFDGFF